MSQGRELLACWCRWRAGGRPNVAGREGLLYGPRALLEGAGVVHGRLQVLGIPHLHVDANVVRQAADEQLGTLASRDAGRVARQGLEAVREVLHRGGEGKAAELGQPAPAYRGPEPEEAEVAESLPRGHPALVLLEGVVPCLGVSAEVLEYVMGLGPLVLGFA